MRKLQKATVMAVVLGSFGFLGAGTAYAHGEKGGTDIDIKQGSQCRSHDTNADVLGEVGILNGLAGNAIGGEGSAGGQSTRMGSSMGCDNSADIKEGKSGDEDRGGGSEGRGSEGREGNGDKGGDARKCGCSDGGEGKEGREQQGMTPRPGLRYTVRTETLTTS
ncbi:hypothetical protein GR130_22310 [Streptomyces sp. GS7]|nr:hypothetical protein GR130_22310 [Streptomyces sp. GS7]